MGPSPGRVASAKPTSQQPSTTSQQPTTTPYATSVLHIPRSPGSLVRRGMLRRKQAKTRLERDPVARVLVVRGETGCEAARRCQQAANAPVLAPSASNAVLSTHQGGRSASASPPCPASAPENTKRAGRPRERPRQPPSPHQTHLQRVHPLSFPVRVIHEVHGDFRLDNWAFHPKCSEPLSAQ